MLAVLDAEPREPSGVAPGALEHVRVGPSVAICELYEDLIPALGRVALEQISQNDAIARGNPRIRMLRHQAPLLPGRSFCFGP